MMTKFTRAAAQKQIVPVKGFPELRARRRDGQVSAGTHEPWAPASATPRGRTGQTALRLARHDAVQM